MFKFLDLLFLSLLVDKFQKTYIWCLGNLKLFKSICPHSKLIVIENLLYTISLNFRYQMRHKKVFEKSYKLGYNRDLILSIQSCPDRFVVSSP